MTKATVMIRATIADTGIKYYPIYNKKGPFIEGAFLCLRSILYDVNGCLFIAKLC